MKRKEFLKDGCSVCVGVMAGLSISSLLTSCASGKIVKAEVIDKQVIVLKSVFTPEQNFVMVRAEDLNYDVLLKKDSEVLYTAILMQCSHYDNPVFANKTEIFCPTHGSKFDFTGKVLKEPATENLKTYKTSILDNQIIIYIQ